MLKFVYMYMLLNINSAVHVTHYILNKWRLKWTTKSIEPLSLLLIYASASRQFSEVQIIPSYRFSLQNFALKLDLINTWVSIEMSLCIAWNIYSKFYIKAS